MPQVQQQPCQIEGALLRVATYIISFTFGYPAIEHDYGDLAAA